MTRMGFHLYYLIRLKGYNEKSRNWWYAVRANYKKRSGCNEAENRENDFLFQCLRSIKCALTNNFCQGKAHQLLKSFSIEFPLYNNRALVGTIKEKSVTFRSCRTQLAIGRMGKPEEIGSLALYLCSDEASFITGSCISINGGFITLNT